MLWSFPTEIYKRVALMRVFSRFGKRQIVFTQSGPVADTRGRHRILGGSAMGALRGVRVEKPFSAYRGDGPYVFVCYAHEDADAVYREITWLNECGVNVWFDEGISPGSEWTEELASAIQGCSRVLYFVTPNSVVSKHCRRELNFAQEEDRDVVAIYLQATDVPAGLRLSLNDRQAILMYDLSEEEYRKRLTRVAQGGPGSAVAPTPVSRAKKSGSKAALAVAAVALIVVTVGVGWLVERDVEPDETEPVTVVDEVQASDPEVLPNSIAVLPFENLSPDPKNAYFAAGIHEEILNQLAKIQDLSVIARTTMVRYANSEKSIPEIGKELNVRSVMEGSVRYAGDRVRITVQLVDPASGAQLWSQAYEEKLEDIFGIQLAIATKIANTLEADLSPQEKQRIGRRTTNKPEAYRYYLQALSEWGNFAATGPTIEALDAAISVDPDFAEALAFKAWIHAVEAAYGSEFFGEDFGSQDQARLINLVEQLSNRAVQIDDQQSFAHLAMSYVHNFYREWDAGLKSDVRGYNLSPNNYIAASQGVLIALRDGKFDAAVRLADHAITMNPADVAAIWNSSELFYMYQLWDAAIEKARLVTTLMPDAALGYRQLARIYGRLGDPEKTREYAMLAEARNPTLEDLVWVALAYGHAGKTGEAQRMFDLAGAGRKDSGLNYEQQFWLHMAIRGYDNAMRHLEQGIRNNFPVGMIFVLHVAPDHPDYDPIRSQPQFDMLLQQILEPLR